MYQFSATQKIACSLVLYVTCNKSKEERNREINGEKRERKKKEKREASMMDE